MHPDDLPDTSPVPLWPTPWYLRLIGKKKWFYYKTRFLEEFPTGKPTVELTRIYVNGTHEIN